MSVSSLYFVYFLLEIKSVDDIAFIYILNILPMFLELGFLNQR